MSMLRVALSCAGVVCALSPFVPAGALGCEPASPAQFEPDPSEQEVVAATVAMDLAMAGALLDDTPEARPLSITVLSARAVTTPGRPWPITRPLHKLLRAWGLSLPDDCTTEGPWVDDDRDGIPGGTPVSLSCTSPVDVPPVGEVAGTVVVLDTDDSSPQSGYWLDFRGLGIRIRDVNGAAWTRTVNGQVSVVVPADPASGAVEVARDLVITLEHTVHGRTTNEATVTFTGALTYSAAALGAHAAPTRSGTTTITHRGEARRWTWHADPELHWEPACKRAAPHVPGFDRGTAVYTDDRENVIRVGFTSCTRWSLALNGRAL